MKDYYNVSIYEDYIAISTDLIIYAQWSPIKYTIKFNSNELIYVAFFSSIILQLLVNEVPFLQKVLKTVSIPYLHLTYLFLISSLILIIVEIIKMNRKTITLKHNI